MVIYILGRPKSVKLANNLESYNEDINLVTAICVQRNAFQLIFAIQKFPAQALNKKAVIYQQGPSMFFFHKVHMAATLRNLCYPNSRKPYQGFLDYNELILISAWISNCIHYKEWDIGNIIMEIMQSQKSLISTTGIPILVRQHLYIQSDPPPPPPQPLALDIRHVDSWIMKFLDT